jgi:hypothetical protein
MATTIETLAQSEEGIPMNPVQNPQPAAYGERRKLPVLAGFLSLMPGLGLIYVGYYRRGFTNILIVAGVIALVASNDPGIRALKPFLGLFLAFFWLYNILDAIRTAGLYNDAVAGMAPEDLRRELVLTGRGGSIAGGLGLIAFGVLFFLNTMFDVPLTWLKDWWPLAPVIFGAYLLVRGIQDRREKAGAGNSR